MPRKRIRTDISNTTERECKIPLGQQDRQVLKSLLANLPMKNLPIDLYCSLFGDTKVAIHRRVGRGQWEYGKQVIRVNGQRQLWINLAWVDRWVTRQAKELRTFQETDF